MTFASLSPFTDRDLLGRGRSGYDTWRRAGVLEGAGVVEPIALSSRRTTSALDVPRVRSFEEFYASEAETVHRAVRASVPNADVAREAVDEAMTRAYANWAKVGTYDAPTWWVYRTAVNWSISRWRKVRREEPLPTDDARSSSTDVEIDPEGALAIAALRQLPLDQREVVVCRVVLDFDIATTARALGIAEGTVKSRLSRGLAELRRVLRGEP